MTDRKLSGSGDDEGRHQHVYTCTRCESDVRLACEIVGGYGGGAYNDGFRLACGCLTMTFDRLDDDTTLPPNWVVDMDYEMPQSATSP